jgi:hypothetical protein
MMPISEGINYLVMDQISGPAAAGIGATVPRRIARKNYVYRYRCTWEYYSVLSSGRLSEAGSRKVSGGPCLASHRKWGFHSRTVP